jgi:hypothetical protein
MCLTRHFDNRPGHWQAMAPWPACFFPRWLHFVFLSWGVAMRIDRRSVIRLLGTTAATVGTGTAQVVFAKEKGEIAKFIELAMSDVDEGMRKQVEELHRRGIYPLLIRPPFIVPFGDWDYFYLAGNLDWEPNKGQNYKPVRVPRGFVTDLASVPRAFWSILTPTGRYAYAAVVHDYLYWTQERSRRDADEIFRIAMEDAKTPTATLLTLYNAVRAVGGLAWDANKNAKNRGERRIIQCAPEDRLVSWAEWSKRPNIFTSDAGPDCAPWGY